MVDWREWQISHTDDTSVRVGRSLRAEDEAIRTQTTTFDKTVWHLPESQQRFEHFPDIFEQDGLRLCCRMQLIGLEHFRAIGDTVQQQGYQR